MCVNQTMNLMNDVERAMVRDFIDNHVCRRASFWKRQPLRNVRVVEAPPNGIGPAWIACCSCGERADIADVSTW